jgi:ABC-type branched-subunit amino acid transport system ATPase component
VREHAVDRVTVLQQGRVLVEGRPDEIKDNSKVQACRDLADAGQTIVVVEQNLAAALSLA